MDCEDKFIFQSTDLPNKSFMFFEAKREEFCDITLKVGKRSITAHRMILSAAIPYFYDIFCDKLPLNSEEKQIDFPNIDPDALKSLIDFAYTCQIEINDDNVKYLLSAASLLRVDQVKNECFRFLVERIKPENALSTCEVLFRVCNTEELEKVNSYIRDNFEEISHTNDILNIPFDSLKDITEDDNLQIAGEECVFETVVKWVKQFPEERKQHLPILLKNVRMTFIKPSYIRNRILKEELIRTSTECRDLVDEAMYYHSTPDARGEVCHFVTRPRNLAANAPKDVDEISSIYAMHFKMDTTIQSLNANDTEWKITHNSRWISECTKLTACVLNKTVYLFHPNFTYVYDLQENVFAFCKKMTLPRMVAACVPHNSKLYVLGGIVYDPETTEATNTVQCFNPKTHEWIVLTGMNIHRNGLGTVAFGEFIYSLGGVNSNDGVLNSVERCDVKTGNWTMMPPMLSNRSWLGCAMLNDKIYVCGGKQTFMILQSTAEVFDPVVNEWKYISMMKYGIILCKLVPFCGKLYSIGGIAGSSNLGDIQIYEPETNTWKSGPPVKSDPCVVCAAVVNMPSECVTKLL